jgi:hypothetical protein
MNQEAQPVAAPPAKKGMSSGAKIAIGCGVVALIAVLVLVIGLVTGGAFLFKKAKEAGFDPELARKNPGLAAAKMVVAANPELELQRVDEKEGTLTIRHKETGETLTVDYRDIEKGKLSFKTDEGEMTFRADESGAQVQLRDESGETQVMDFGGTADDSRIPEWIPRYPGKMTVTFTMSESGEQAGQFAIEMTGALEDARDFYVSELEGQGFSVEVSSMTFGEARMFNVTATSEDASRVLTVTIQDMEGKKTIINNYRVKE